MVTLYNLINSLGSGSRGLNSPERHRVRLFDTSARRLQEVGSCVKVEPPRVSQSLLLRGKQLRETSHGVSLVGASTSGLGGVRPIHRQPLSIPESQDLQAWEYVKPSAVASRLPELAGVPQTRLPPAAGRTDHNIDSRHGST